MGKSLLARTLNGETPSEVMRWDVVIIDGENLTGVETVYMPSLGNVPVANDIALTGQTGRWRGELREVAPSGQSVASWQAVELLNGDTLAFLPHQLKRLADFE